MPQTSNKTLLKKMQGIRYAAEASQFHAPFSTQRVVSSLSILFCRLKMFLLVLLLVKSPKGAFSNDEWRCWRRWCVTNHRQSKQTLHRTLLKQFFILNCSSWHTSKCLQPVRGAEHEPFPHTVYSLLEVEWKHFHWINCKFSKFTWLQARLVEAALSRPRSWNRECAYITWWGRGTCGYVCMNSLHFELSLSFAPQQNKYFQTFQLSKHPLFLHCEHSLLVLMLLAGNFFRMLRKSFRFLRFYSLFL